MGRRLSMLLLPLVLGTAAILLCSGSADALARAGGGTVVAMPPGGESAGPGLQEPGVGEPGAEAQQPENAVPPPQDPLPHDVYFPRDFGDPGQPGSFRVYFDRRGASIWSIDLLDHYATLDDARKAERGEPGVEYYRLVAPVERGEPSLYLVRGTPQSMEYFPRPVNGSGNVLWEREELPDGERFTLDGGNGLVLEKTYRHLPGRRELSLEIALKATETQDAEGGVLYLELVGLSVINPKESSLFANPSMAIGAFLTAEGGIEEVAVARGGSSGSCALPGMSSGSAPTEAGDLIGGGRPIAFAGTTNRFFAGMLYPTDAAGQDALYAVVADPIPKFADEDTGTQARSVPRAVYKLRLKIPAPRQEDRSSFAIYLGPKSYRAFDEFPEYARFLAIMDTDLEPPCCVPVPGGRFLATLLLKLLSFFQSVVGNWGVAVVMLTLLVRGLLLPLNFRMQKSMRVYGKKMAVLKPKMDKLKEQYADDPKAYQQAMVQFQRENKIFPPLGGCLPIFLTMPVYIGLFSALRVAYDLRQQPFILWVDDLSRPDALFELGWSFLPYFNLLPLVWIGLFLWMQRSMPLPSDPQQRQVQKIMRYMPLIFGVLLYNYASALLVYMVTSMMFSMVESRITKKILGPISPEAAAMAPTPI